MNTPPRDPDLPELVAQVLDDVGDLVDVHLALARAEVGRDLRRATGAGLVLLTGGLFAALGGLLLHVAVAAVLLPWLGVAWVAGALGLADVLVGGVALAVGANRLRGGEEALTWGAELGHTARSLLQRPPAAPEAVLHGE